jgi:hypothetical protein
MVNKEDFAALMARVEELEKLVQRVADLEKSNEAKDKKIRFLEDELKARPAAIKPIDWSNLFRADAKKTSEEIKIVNAITAVNKDIEKRVKNIVIVGLNLSLATDTDKKIEDDRSTVEEIFDSLNIGRNNIKRIYRFKPKPNATGSPILVELPSNIDRNKVLKEAKNLKSNNKFKGVYINPDQNEAERKLTGELVKERNIKNQQLDNEGKLNKPFRWGIRDNKVVQITINK